MSNKNIPNFPDILGEITGGTRANLGLVQVAVAIRPRVIRAGRPFETILLVQNVSDVAIDFEARIRLPDRDAEGKKGRFVTKIDKLVVGLESAQVGYLILPVSSLPDTAISENYTIAMDIQIKQAGDAKPNRVRLPDGGGEVDPDQLANGVAKTIDELSRLNWSAEKVAGLRSSGLEINFALMSGTVGKIADLQPSWESLWILADLAEDGVILTKYRKQLLEHVLPNLTLRQIYPVALEVTSKNFEKAGFTLSTWETIVISKMMTLMLILAQPTRTELLADNYNLMPFLEENAEVDVKRLPHWTKGFLKLVNREPRALKQPIKAIFHYCYEELMYDAIMHAFQRIETVFNLSPGDPEERATYRDEVLANYRNGKLSFSQVYLPLVVGGITAVDVLSLPEDDMEDAVVHLSVMVDARRRKEFNEETATLFNLVDSLMAKVLLKYGYNTKRI